MNNITLDTTNFSEQLGIYDFFNVIISGAVFVFGVCVISDGIYNFLWADTTTVKGLAIVLAVYISGLVLQELGSIVDQCFIRVQKRVRGRFLCDIKESFFDRLTGWFLGLFSKQARIPEAKNNERQSNTSKGLMRKKKCWNCVVSNELVLKNYRNLADQVYKKCFPDAVLKDDRFNDENFNAFIFTTIQYYVSQSGKDRKTEKLRALFDMSRTLMVCFAILSLVAVVALITPNCLPSELGLRCDGLLIVACACSVLMAFLFLFRMFRTKKNMVLITLGNCDAYLRTIKEEHDSENEMTARVRVRVSRIVKDRR